MTFAASERSGNFRQRSFWLRCFLGMPFVCAAVSWNSDAQVEQQKRLHVAHVAGFVVNSAGTPVVGAAITLDQDGKTVYNTRTDAAGRFRFDHVLGRYVLHVERTQYAPAEREIDVGDLVQTYLERKKIYVIVGPGACADACSPVFTNKRDFENEIKRRAHHAGAKP